MRCLAGLEFGWNLACLRPLSLLCRRMTLLQADSVWEQLLEQTERFLTMRQYAVAVISLMETSLQLQTLHHPWLAALRRPVANE